MQKQRSRAVDLVAARMEGAVATDDGDVLTVSVRNARKVTDTYARVVAKCARKAFGDRHVVVEGFARSVTPCLKAGYSVAQCR